MEERVMKKSFVKKLSLSKITVSNLDARALGDLKGGSDDHETWPEDTCMSYKVICTVTWITGCPFTCTSPE
jgi:hypothetical protein